MTMMMMEKKVSYVGTSAGSWDSEICKEFTKERNRISAWTDKCSFQVKLKE
jgi:hypothetical protein